MKELYRRMSSINPNEENRLLTVLRGPGAGAKALVTGSSIVWRSGDGSAEGMPAELFPAACPGDLPACGTAVLGGQEVFSELLTSGKKLVICGGGHVSVPVIRIGKMLGFHVTVLEDRQWFADRAGDCGADRVISAPYEEGLDAVRGSRDSYFVIVTRAHRHDADCLRKILGMPHAYIGMMGSRRRVAIVKEMLAEEGADRALLDAVHTPIGLAIGAETPEEIAVSILAEIIGEKNRAGRTSGFPEPVLEAVLDLYGEREEGKPGSGVLATIIRKQGAAPRRPGTKMLIRGLGAEKGDSAGAEAAGSAVCGTVGTIGGGCAEAKVISAALLMLKNGERFRILHADLSGEAAAEEGMVCGGTLDVMLERI